MTIGKLGNREIDFIAKKQQEKIYVQVAYMLASPETIDGNIHQNIRDFLLP